MCEESQRCIDSVRDMFFNLEKICKNIFSTKDSITLKVSSTVYLVNYHWVGQTVAAFHWSCHWSAASPAWVRRPAATWTHWTFDYKIAGCDVDCSELLPLYKTGNMNTQGHSLKLKKRSCNYDNTFLEFELWTFGIAYLLKLSQLPQLTVSKDDLIDTA